MFSGFYNVYEMSSQKNVEKNNYAQFQLVTFFSMKMSSFPMLHSLSFIRKIVDHH